MMLHSGAMFRSARWKIIVVSKATFDVYNTQDLSLDTLAVNHCFASLGHDYADEVVNESFAPLIHYALLTHSHTPRYRVVAKPEEATLESTSRANPRHRESSWCRSTDQPSPRLRPHEHG